ncbi:hypothetical protein Taro_029026 [Colocasia esculenta]|uniref:Uncharacterized protein n=1 Tax=Colocasia esculenta TaxID=4460 RepID=A0A843VVZ6_COLES|nr:hypothetical protein [Colocasia esculenta]
MYLHLFLPLIETRSSSGRPLRPVRDLISPRCDVDVAVDVVCVLIALRRLVCVLCTFLSPFRFFVAGGEVMTWFRDSRRTPRRRAGHGFGEDVKDTG